MLTLYEKKSPGLVLYASFVTRVISSWSRIRPGQEASWFVCSQSHKAEKWARASDVDENPALSLRTDQSTYNSMISMQGNC